jgi:uncharacterized protein YjiK
MGKKNKASHPRARVLQEHALGVQEASGVARLADGDLLVVDDEHGVFRCPIGGSPRNLEVARGLKDLEGICISSDGATAWLLSERDGGIWKHAIVDGELLDGTRVGELPRQSSRKNQGWEGIAYAAPGVLGQAATLVAVHQKKPRAVGLFDADTLAERRIIPLDKRSKKALGDLNDVAVNPDDGRLLVVSGKKGMLAELSVEQDGLVVHRLFRVEHDDDDVPEGVTYDGEGRLWLVTDGKGWLRELSLAL